MLEAKNEILPCSKGEGILRKMEKRFTTAEFNKKYFNNWKNIKAVYPKFEEWGDEEEENKQQVISELEIEFTNGEKIVITPYSNKDDDYEDNEGNPLSYGLNIFTFDRKLINFKDGGKFFSSQP